MFWLNFFRFIFKSQKNLLKSWKLLTGQSTPISNPEDLFMIMKRINLDLPISNLMIMFKLAIRSPFFAKQTQEAPPIRSPRITHKRRRFYTQPRRTRKHVVVSRWRKELLYRLLFNSHERGSARRQWCNGGEIYWPIRLDFEFRGRLRLANGPRLERPIKVTQFTVSRLT